MGDRENLSDWQSSSDSESMGPARVTMGLFGLIPGCVGVTLLYFLWGPSDGGLGNPPVFFKLFASFVATAFVIFSASWVIRALSRPMKTRSFEPRRARRERHEQGAYECPNCGSGVHEDADVSPSGDVKCAFCKNWFSVRRNS